MKNKKWILARQAIIFTFIYFIIVMIVMILELCITKKIVTDYKGYHVIGFSFYMGVLASFGAFNAVDKKTMVQSDKGKDDEK